MEKVAARREVGVPVASGDRTGPGREAIRTGPTGVRGRGAGHGRRDRGAARGRGRGPGGGPVRVGRGAARLRDRGRRRGTGVLFSVMYLGIIFYVGPLLVWCYLL